MTAVADNAAQHRFEMPIDASDEVAAAFYRIDGDRIVLTHAIVPERFSGQGLGSKLARGTFDAIRVSGCKAVLRCPLTAAYCARHHEYPDIVAAERQDD